MKHGLIITNFAVFVICAANCACTVSETNTAEGFVLRKQDELAQFKKVEIGMTADEVDAILGSPQLVVDDCRYYGHTPRIRPIDSPYSPYSIIVSMEDSKVKMTEYVPDRY